MKKSSILFLLIPIIALAVALATFFIYNERVAHTFSEVYKESQVVYRDQPNDNSEQNFYGYALGMLQAPTNTLKELFNNELISMKIRNICRVISDSDNNQYFIDNSRGRIVKTDARGNFVYSIPSDVMEKNLLCPFVDIAVDKDGYLYVLNEISDVGGYYVTA